MLAQEDGKKLFGALLVESGLITLEQLQAALEEQKANGGRLGFTLLPCLPQLLPVARVAHGALLLFVFFLR